MTQLQKILLNGQQYSIKQEITLSDLIHYFSYDSSLLVLEYNNVICNKKIGEIFTFNIKIKLKLLQLLVVDNSINYYRIIFNQIFIFS
jgi:sulfur carrier protein ThiS